jgi:hypothetical protein
MSIWSSFLKIIGVLASLRKRLFSFGGKFEFSPELSYYNCTYLEKLRDNVLRIHSKYLPRKSHL